MHTLSEIARWVGAVPLVWLIVLALLGKSRPPLWWWIALGLGVSWVSDTAGKHTSTAMIGNLYPITQAGLIAGALTTSRRAIACVVVFVGVALLSLVLTAPSGCDVLLRTVTFGTMAGLAYQAHIPRLLRASFVVLFGYGLVLWYAFAVEQSFPTLWAFQTARLLGTLLFCWAAWNESRG